MVASSRKPSLPLYFVLACGITWLGWIPAILLSQSRELLLPTLDNLPALARNGFADGAHRAIAVAFQLAVYGPLAAALVTIGASQGRKGLRDLWRRMTAWRVAPVWYRRVSGLALVLAATPPVVGALLGLMDWSVSAALRRMAWLLPILLLQLLTSGLGEEPGWRGLMLPELVARHGRQRAIWVGGLLWAVWHYPITIITTLNQIGADLPPVQLLITLIMALAGQTMTLIGMTYFYLWITRHTRSVWMAMLFHALSNALVFVFAAQMPPALTVAIAVMPWLVVWALQKALGDERFP